MDFNIAGGRIHLGIDRCDRSVDGIPGQGVGGDAHLVIRLDGSQLLLGQQKIDIDRVNRLQRYDGVAGVKNLTQIDQSYTQPAAERRSDRFLGDSGANIVCLGHCLFVLGSGVIVLGLGYGIVGQQFAHPVEIDLGQLRCGICRT